MSSKKRDSGYINFPIFVTEIDRLTDDEESQGEYRQLCGVTIQCSKLEVRVFIYTAAGAISYGIPRDFPDKAIHIKAGQPRRMAADN